MAGVATATVAGAPPASAHVEPGCDITHGVHTNPPELGGTQFVTTFSYSCWSGAVVTCKSSSGDKVTQSMTMAPRLYQSVNGCPADHPTVDSYVLHADLP